MEGRLDRLIVWFVVGCLLAVMIAVPAIIGTALADGSATAAAWITAVASLAVGLIINFAGKIE